MLTPLEHFGQLVRHFPTHITPSSASGLRYQEMLCLQVVDCPTVSDGLPSTGHPQPLLNGVW